jgi:uncharacterized membrane protein
MIKKCNKDVVFIYKIDEEKQLLYTRIGAILFATLAVAFLNLGFINLLYVIINIRNCKLRGYLA